MRHSAAILAAFSDAGKMPALLRNCHYIMQHSLIPKTGGQ
jgi:hypothetical protein